jgi:hypothetical protein
MGGAGHTFRHIGTSIHCQKRNLYTNAPASKKKNVNFSLDFIQVGNARSKRAMSSICWVVMLTRLIMKKCIIRVIEIGC